MKRFSITNRFVWLNDPLFLAPIYASAMLFMTGYCFVYIQSRHVLGSLWDIPVVSHYSSWVDKFNLYADDALLAAVLLKSALLICAILVVGILLANNLLCEMKKRLVYSSCVWLPVLYKKGLLILIGCQVVGVLFVFLYCGRSGYALNIARLLLWCSWVVFLIHGAFCLILQYFLVSKQILQASAELSD